MTTYEWAALVFLLSLIAGELGAVLWFLFLIISRQAREEGRLGRS